MRPVKTTEAHKTDRLAELVCSNTFKSTEVTNAHGLLKAEMRLLGSIVLQAADEARVPAGTALAVDRDVFSAGVHDRLVAHPRVTARARRRHRTAVAGHRRDGAAHERGARRRDRPRPRRRDARVLRCHRADRLDRVDRHGRRVPRIAIRQGDDGRRGGRVPELRDDPRAVRVVHRRAHGGRPVHRARVRQGALLRGMHAGRGDGAARAGNRCVSARSSPSASRTRGRGAGRTPSCSCGARTARDACGTSSASRPG